MVLYVCLCLYIKVSASVRVCVCVKFCLIYLLHLPFFILLSTIIPSILILFFFSIFSPATVIVCFIMRAFTFSLFIQLFFFACFVYIFFLVLDGRFRNRLCARKYGKIIHNGAFVLQSFNIINIKLLVFTHDWDFNRFPSVCVCVLLSKGDELFFFIWTWLLWRE